jgi:tubulin---tyrosine ligase
MWIAQKYIERPLLYRRRKFDIRLWALVTSDFKIYKFNQGYVRTTSEIYEADSQDKFVHLTNECLQNKSSSYSKHEEGNTISFFDLQNFLDEAYGELNVNIEDHFIPRMQDIIIDTFLSG